jgi:hypothetical protein
VTIFVVVLLTVLVVAFVGYPLFKRKPQVVNLAEDKLEERYSKRDAAYTVLKELEFDYQSGILSEDDYRELEAKYKSNAISILKDIDSMEKGGTDDLEDEIEKRVLELRHGEKKQTCPQCGSEYEAGARFCSQCGTNLVEEEKVD